MRVSTHPTITAGPIESAHIGSDPEADPTHNHFGVHIAGVHGGRLYLTGESRAEVLDFLAAISAAVNERAFPDIVADTLAVHGGEPGSPLAAPVGGAA
jgi:UDP-N-acetylmuramate-alanine ligase